MGIFKEFREFAVQGSVLDLAVGVVIGGVFNPIVKSLVDDIIMPPIGLLLGNMDFKELFLLLKPGSEIAPPYLTLAAAQEAGAVTLNYGNFINLLITFLITAAAIFMVVRMANRWRKQDGKEEAAV